MVREKQDEVEVKSSNKGRVKSAVRHLHLLVFPHPNHRQLRRCAFGPLLRSDRNMRRHSSAAIVMLLNHKVNRRTEAIHEGRWVQRPGGGGILQPNHLV